MMRFGSISDGQQHRNRNTTTWTRLLAALALAALIAGCLNSSPSPPSSGNGEEEENLAARDHGVRFVHGADSEGPVDVYIDGERAVTGLPYSRSTPYLIHVPGTEETELQGDVEFTVVPHEADPSEAILSTTLDYDDDVRFTAFIEEIGGSLDLRLVDEHFEGEEESPTVMRFTHLISDVGPIDIYLDQGSHDDFSALTPSHENVAPGTTLDYQDVLIEESTRVVVTLAGESEILFDSVSSSSGRTLYFRDGERLHLILMPTDGQAFFGAPAFSRAATQALLQSDTRTRPVLTLVDGRARIQVVHAVEDGPSVDVRVDGETVYQDLAYGDATSGTILMPGDRTVELFDSDSGASIALEHTDFTLARTSEYAVVFVGSHAAGEMDLTGGRVDHVSRDIPEDWDDWVYLNWVNAYYAYTDTADPVFNSELVGDGLSLDFADFIVFPSAQELPEPDADIEFFQSGTFEDENIRLADTVQTLEPRAYYTAILAGIHGDGSEPEILLVRNLIDQE